MLKRKRDHIKTMHSLGKIHYKDAKKEIQKLGFDKEERKSRIVKIPGNTWGHLVNIAYEHFSKDPEQGPHRIIEKMKRDKKINSLIKNGKIEEHYLKEAILDALKRHVSQLNSEHH